MARKSKSVENKEITSDDNALEQSGADVATDAVTSESTADDPLILEAEAVETSDLANDDPVTSVDEDSDDQLEAEPEPVPDAASETAMHTAPSSAGTNFFALVLGGLLAGGLGYFAATQFQSEPPAMDTAAITDGIDRNATQIDDLASRLGSLGDLVQAPDTSGVEAKLDSATQALTASLADLSAAQDEMLASIEALEARGLELAARLSVIEAASGAENSTVSSADIDAFREEIVRMTSDAEARLVEAQQKAVEAEQAAAEAQAIANAEVAEAEAAAARQAALVDLKVAVESGAAYADLLAKIENAPEALVANAQSGVPTIGDLQRGFPSAARVALATSETVPEDASAGERFSAFLKRQTNARSLSPKEGDGVDAILSRAEGHIGNGDLDAALNELSALPEDGRSAMSTWIDQAIARASVLDALHNLTATN